MRFVRSRAVMDSAGGDVLSTSVIHLAIHYFHQVPAWQNV